MYMSCPPLLSCARFFFRNLASFPPFKVVRYTVDRHAAILRSFNARETEKHLPILLAAQVAICAEKSQEHAYRR